MSAGTSKETLTIENLKDSYIKILYVVNQKLSNEEMDALLGATLPIEQHDKLKLSAQKEILQIFSTDTTDNGYELDNTENKVLNDDKFVELLSKKLEDAVKSKKLDIILKNGKTMVDIDIMVSLAEQAIKQRKNLAQNNVFRDKSLKIVKVLCVTILLFTGVLMMASSGLLGTIVAVAPTAMGLGRFSTSIAAIQTTAQASMLRSMFGSVGSYILGTNLACHACVWLHGLVMSNQNNIKECDISLEAIAKIKSRLDQLSNDTKFADSMKNARKEMEGKIEQDQDRLRKHKKQ
jgi:hypothetical protein